jgi:hypothetical protein
MAKMAVRENKYDFGAVEELYMVMDTTNEPAHADVNVTVCWPPLVGVTVPEKV